MTSEERSARVEEILTQMTEEEKVALCSGKDFWHTKDFPRLRVPSVLLSDGPNGLRRQAEAPDSIKPHRRDEASDSGDPRRQNEVSDIADTHRQGEMSGNADPPASGTSDHAGPETSAPATCYPTAVTAAQTWNRRLLYEEGRAIGEEAREQHVAVVPGPGVNIKRNPLCGRNFEYYSEDPVTAGELGASFVNGMQNETGIGASLKHFACNSQEYRRMQSDSQLDERTLREIYLRAFEKVVKEAQPATVMCAYNRVNGTYCSDNVHLLREILREDWGFRGAVVTDWGALNDRTAGFRAGCDLAMPGGSEYGEKTVLKALREERLRPEPSPADPIRNAQIRTNIGSDIRNNADGAAQPKQNGPSSGAPGHQDPHGQRSPLSTHVPGRTGRPGRNTSYGSSASIFEEMSLQECVDASARRVLSLVLQREEALRRAEGYSYDRTSHRETARRMAEEGAVLLRNVNRALPIRDVHDIVLIGAMASNLRFQGSGSSRVHASRVRQLRDCLPEAAYVQGCDDEGNVTEESLAEVTQAARLARKAVVVVGLTERYESEGFDRRNLSIPAGHNRMVKAALAGNPDTIVVLIGGSPMKLPWFEDVTAVLYLGLCGQEGGEAAANLLTGKVTPSGKLAETWPLEEYDIPCYGFYGESGGNSSCGCRDAQYREGIYVGYRYYDKAGVRVRFPFGFGLSYAQFEYSDLHVIDRTVTVRICNTGAVAGAEVVQLYVGNPQDGIPRPLKELRAFDKIRLRPGTSAVVSFELAGRDFAVWQDGWRIPTGTYRILIGASSADIRLSQDVVVSGTDPKELYQSLSAPLDETSWYLHPTGQPTLGDWRQLMEAKAQEPETMESGDGRCAAPGPETIVNNGGCCAAPGPGSFDLNSSLLDLAPYSRVSRFVLRQIEKTCIKAAGGDVDSPDCRMAIASSAGAPLRTLKIFAPQLPIRVLHLLLWLGNHARKRK